MFQQLHSQHPSTNLPHFWIHKLPIPPCYKHWNRMGVFHCKRNKFFETAFSSQCLNELRLYWIWGSTKMHPMEVKSMLLQFPCHAYKCHWLSSVYWLMSVSQKLDQYSLWAVAYRRLFFYHQLAHGPAYTRNADGWLGEPHCSMFYKVLQRFPSIICEAWCINPTYVFVTNETFSHAMIHR